MIKVITTPPGRVARSVMFHKKKSVMKISDLIMFNLNAHDDDHGKVETFFLGRSVQSVEWELKLNY